MSEPYPKAPITEAVIALHFSASPSAQSLEKFAGKQRKNFPKFETIHQVTTKINVKTSTQDASFEVSGYKLTNADTGIVIRASRNQFGVSKLAPYSTWEELFGAAHQAWDEFRKSIGHIQLSRLSTRFINRIDIPAKDGQEVKIDDYFTMGIVLPKASEHMDLLQYGLSCRLNNTENNSFVVIRLNTVDPPLLDHVSIALDVDVVTNDSIPPNERTVWERINGLRVVKNLIFEGIITDKTRELFK